ncbi:pseudouridine synthase [Paracoccus methylarcula]|uniref:Pseudouridine synthase n=1 Tax=Paracoccus methylarcula TaxID=72022 RepID=A0A3R7LQI3_9RHOB|nr:pseudouridine synthase [Paracoccus methylarcula]RNF35372.1 rRNA pseudouridine synthase [Paracoccus methylarcula]
MTDSPDNSKSTGDRIAKVMARAGVASRREAERMILEGRVTVNGEKIASPALDVSPSDKITVDGKKLEEPQETRLWLYYKPVGLVTSEADDKGRQTVFDALPRDLPRVMTIGRLDLNSEGLLLLTNDGELKRQLELPSTGWLRRYRVRVNGTPNDLSFAPLRRGVTIDGEEFAPMEIKLDSQQGANAWLTVGIREGRNREIRRAMAHIGLQVNRLIRVGYGPFRLTGMEKNEVTEVKRRVLRDQLGGLLTGEAPGKEREMRPRGAEAPRKPLGKRGERGELRPLRGDDRAPRRADGKGGAPRKFGTGPKPDGDRPARGDKPWSKRERTSESRAGDSAAGDRPRRSFGAKPAGGQGARDYSGKPGFKGPRNAGKGGGSGKTFGGKPAGRPAGKPGGRPPGKPRGGPRG